MAAKKQQYYCYLLESTTTNRTYVGFTIDPKKRLKQHNGELRGGAKYTSAGRPWKMILFITGFLTKRHALQMEYAIKRCTTISKEVKVTSKSKNRYINKRVAKLFTMLLKDKVTKTAPLNQDQQYHIHWFDDRFVELETLVGNCRYSREKM